MKVLLADDNITAQRMGSKILIEAGYSVVAVSNGAAAVKKIASEKPELIILDVYMPGYSGLEVCEKVKSAVETMRVPVLLTVTNMEPFNASDGNRVKADGVVVKPFEATDLLSAVKKFAEKLQSPESFVGRTAKTRVVEEFPEEVWQPPPTKPDLPAEIANAPALGLEELQTTGASVSGSSEGSVPDIVLPAKEANFVAESPAELQVNCPQAGEVEVAPAAEFQPTLQESESEISVAQDPALATDPSDFSQFVTKFGQENPEDIPVGIAMPTTEEPVEETSAAPGQQAAEFSIVGEEGDVLEHEKSHDYAEEAPDAPLVMEEATREHHENGQVDRIFALEPTMHDAAIAEIQSLIGEFMHHAETGFTSEKPSQQVIEDSPNAAVATAPEAEAEVAPVPAAGTDTQPVDVWPQMHPAELTQEPEFRTYEAHEESDSAEIGVDTQKIEVMPDIPSNFQAEIDSTATKTVQVEPPASLQMPEAGKAELELDTPEVESAQPESIVTEADLSVAAMDEQRIAAAVNLVLERYKSELIAAILRELQN